MEETTREEIENQIEELLFNMLEKCRIEAQIDRVIKPLEHYVDRVSDYTGITKQSLIEIQYKKQSENTSKFMIMDIDTQILLLKYITKYYSEKEILTYELLYNNLKNVIPLERLEEFEDKLSFLGFQYRTIYNNNILIEDAQYSYDRFFYLDKMQKLRDKKVDVYYLDERLINEELTLKKPWRECVVTEESHEYLFFCAISKFGFKNGLFCNDANQEDFYKWVVDILLGQLEPSSVIVFDNSPLHGKTKSKTISMYDTKEDMLKWLLKHNMPHSRGMNKAQLYELIKRSMTEEEMYPVDRIIKANGHDVLRLPTNLYNLTPVKLMWEELKSSLSTRLLDPLLFEIKDEIHAQLIAMPKEKFVEFEEDIIEKEKQLLTLHPYLEKAQDRYLIDLKTKTLKTKKTVV